MKQALFNWSGGKDSTLALYHILQEGKYSIQSLLTTVSEEFKRISMHGVRQELLLAQAESIGLPLRQIELPENLGMQEYDTIMLKEMNAWKAKGVEYSIFGDIFLDDLKKYREEKLQDAGLKACFPLWKRNTKEILKEFIDLGFKTIVVCVKSDLLSKDFAGRIIDHDFINDLPDNVDPCGENGEFHTFVFDGPIFKQAIPFSIGEKVFRSYSLKSDSKEECFKDQAEKELGFWFCDLLPI